MTTVRMSNDFNFNILIKRMKWGSEVIKYLSCMKHVESSLDLWPTMNVSFSEIVMCIHVIAILQMNIAIA